METKAHLGVGARFTQCLAVLMLLFLLPAAVFAQKTDLTSETGQDHFDAPFPSGGALRIYVRSSGVRITGTDENKIDIHFSVRHQDSLEGVRVKLERDGNRGDLDISGGPSNDFQIDIEIPRQSNLYFRMFAGEIDIDHVEGNKDLEIHAGQMDISLPDTNDYGPVDISVTTGDLEASAFGVSKGGLFRSFRSNTVPDKSSPGKYLLHAHVGAGELDIN